MNAALWKLYRMRVRGSVRSMARKVKSVRGAILAAVVLLVFGTMLVPNLVMAVKLGRAGVLGQGIDSFREVITVVMFLYVVMTIVTSLGERAIYFSPGEVDMLFPAPYSRRQLLLYKIVGSVTAAIYVSLILSVSFVLHLRSWPAAAVGFFLGYLMINSVTMCAQLIAQSIGERAFTRFRKLLLGGVMIAAAVAIGQAGERAFDGSWQESLMRLRHSPVAEVVLAPFAVFAKIITADGLIPGALGWLALGVTIILGFYALAVWLDANYLETAVRVSRQMQERKRRMLSEGVFLGKSKRVVRSTRLRQPPWLGGVGPVVWRQAIQSLRGSNGALTFAVIAVFAIGVPFVIGAGKDKELPKVLPGIIIGVSIYATFLYSSQAPFGFRGDYGRMDFLKSLPIGPTAMACGQMLVAVLVVTLFDWAIFAAGAVAMPAAAPLLVAACLFALPLNWIMFGTESFLFLLYPSPLVATGSEGFLKMGRVMLFMIAKTFMLGGCAIVATIPAGIVIFLTKSVAAACAAAWLALLLPSVGILLLIAWAYRRFDASDGSSE